MFADQIFNRKTSGKIFAPRRQDPKEEYFPIFSELGVLCVFARGVFFPICNPKLSRKFQISLPALFSSSRPVWGIRAGERNS